MTQSTACYCHVRYFLLSAELECKMYIYIYIYIYIYVYIYMYTHTHTQWGVLERTIQKERMLQRTVFINKIRILQRTQMLQRTIFYAFIMESSIIVFSRERLFMLYMSVRVFVRFVRESLLVVFTKERLFMLFKFTYTVYKS